MNMKFFGITWFPLIAYCAFILAVSNERSFNTSDFYIPFITYIASSSSYVSLVQNELTKKSKDSISVITKINSNIICLLISSLIILIHTLVVIENTLWITILILIPFIINIIIFSLTGFQEEQLTIGYERRSKERKESLSSITDWKNYLILLKDRYEENDSLIEEIERIENIINYSSFFRSFESKDILSKVKSTSNIDELTKILKRVV